MFCCTLLYVHSSIAIILMGKRELVALLNMSSWCLMMVERLFLAVSLGCLRLVIVVFPDHTHLLFLSLNRLPNMCLLCQKCLYQKPFLCFALKGRLQIVASDVMKRSINPDIASLASFLWSNSTVPDQMTQSAASNQGLRCLLTECSITISMRLKNAIQ